MEDIKDLISGIKEEIRIIKQEIRDNDVRHEAVKLGNQARIDGLVRIQWNLEDKLNKLAQSEQPKKDGEQNG